jgi:hypothetical protein
MLAGILIGNAVYFTLLPHLPAAARHRPFAFDLGLLLDFVFCVAAYTGVNALLRPSSAEPRP